MINIKDQYTVKVTIPDLIRAKSICSQTQSVCEISDLCFLHGPRSFVARSILKNLGLIFHSTDLTLGQ
jgi:hypothetical protein